MLEKWAVEFKRGRENVEDCEWSGSPEEATRDENVELVLSLIKCGRRRSLRDIAS